MYLTKEEERILDGEYGFSLSLAMKILVAVGEAFNAERLIPISSSHISGISYFNIGDAGLDFISKIAGGCRVKVKTTMNPIGFDLDNPSLFHVSKVEFEKQLKIISCLSGCGVRRSLTCIPYEVSNKPKIGDIISWAESSAVTYANSILGARTNRESGISSLASALIGKTPFYGLLLDENRIPKVKVEVSNEVSHGKRNLSLLGYMVGCILQDKIPFIQGLRVGRVEEFKYLCAGTAAASNISMVWIDNVTPDIRRVKWYGKFEDKIRIGLRELEEFNDERFDSVSIEDADLVFFGCPHYDVYDVVQIVDVCRRIREVNRRCEIWFSMARDQIGMLGWDIVSMLKALGVTLVKDTCIVITKFRSLGFDRVLTDSAKAAHYLKNRFHVEVGLLPSKL